jgi:hypothetical protein
MSRPAPRRLIPWLIANFAFLAFLGGLAALGGATDPRVPYLWVLFAICSSSVLGADRMNGRHAVLIAFSAVYFVFYGLADFARLMPALEIMAPTRSTGLLTAPEVAVLLGALFVAGGYRLALKFGGRVKRPIAAADWPAATAVTLGVVLWAVGALCTWYWHTSVVDRYIDMAQIGMFEGIALLIGRMVQPVGVALLAYRLVVGRSTPLLLLTLAILAAEFVLGFLADSKELAIRGAVMVLAAKFLVEGRVPKSWLAVGAFSIMLSFAVFQSYRLEVLQLRHQTRAAAAQNLSRNLDRTLGSSLLEGGYLQSGLRGFVQRTDMKPAIEIIVARVGHDIKYRGGDTISLLAGAFVPRFLWRDKPDAAVGQLFNREFKLSWDRNTYVSVTHLGELYWNFGWAGVIAGMFIIGAVLGVFGGRFALADQRSLTRFLIVSTTLYLLAARFEGGIALTYTVWIRSVLLILVMHLVFAKARRTAAPQEVRSPALA